MRVDVYSRHDAFVGTIAPDQLLSFTHTDELNGEDSVDISTTFHLHEGQRLVWADGRGVAHEHVCQDPRGEHTSSGIVWTDTALASICETFGDFIEDKRPYSYTFARALETALAPSRWDVGTVDQGGTVSSGLTFYHTSVREAIQSILECGGELELEIGVGGSGVTSRKVGIRAHRGETGGHRRFAWGKDVTSVRKTEHWGAITACYGYGKGVKTDSGGYGRRLTFSDINGGKAYVEDSDALKTYGRPDGSGGMAHVFGQMVDEECEDASALLSETRAYLDAHKVPGITYEADAADLVAMGREWEGVGVGDDVQLVDSEYDPPLRCAGRVSKLVTDVLAGTQVVTLGNVSECMADDLAAMGSRLSSLARRSSGWDVAAATPGAYLQQIIDGLNEQFNAQGMSYCFTSFEQGTIWSSVPLDEHGKPTRAGGSAIQICSQGFRIASGTRSDGSWNWRSFGTGNGFTADLITAGSIRGGSNTWNLDTGDLTFRQGSITINGPSGVQIAISSSAGFKIYQKGSFIGGIEVVDGKAHLRAARAGTTSSLYMTTGKTGAGNPGASFVDSSGNYLDIEALHAVDGPANESNGVGFACFDKPFMTASTYYGHAWLYPPVHSQDYMTKPPEQLVLVSGTRSSARMQRSETEYVNLNDTSASLQFDSTHYVRVSSDGVQCRCGDKGFGWMNGKFYDSLTW